MKTERERIALEMAYTTWEDSCKAPHPDGKSDRYCRRPRGHRAGGTPCASGHDDNLLIWTATVPLMPQAEVLV